MEAAICEKCNKPFPPGGACRIAEYLPTINQLSIQPDSNVLEQIVCDLPTYCNSADWLFPYLDNPNLEISLEAALLLSKLEGPSQRMLTHSKTILRTALTLNRQAGKLEDILLLLEDKDILVRTMTLYALTNVNGNGCLEHVLPHLQDEAVGVQIAAIQVLPYVGGSLEHLLPFLKAENWEVRTEAVSTLPFLDGTLEHVLPSLQDTHENVRWVAVKALFKLGGQLEHLLPSLEDTDSRVRAEAVKNLPRLGGQLEHLLPLLEDENWEVCFSAIQVLHELGGNIKHIRPKLQDSLAVIREVALENLFKLGGTLEDIVPLLTDENLIVRNIAFYQILTFVGSCEDKATLNEVIRLCQRLIVESKLADIKIASREILELIARRNIMAALALFNSDDPELHAEGEARLRELDPSAIFIEEKAQRQPSLQDVELDDK